MGVQEFEKVKVLAPFLGSPLQFIPGQDPLGLLNVGGLTFDKLLQGLNNVTGRIRYYSFYCWFFHLYAKTIRIPTKKEQFKFLRRAEYLLALLSAKHNWGGIAGINKASLLYNGSIQLFSLADGTGENTINTEGSYWKNPRGVFGQNYVNSMNHLGLIKERNEGEGVFIRTDFSIEGRISGVQIAEAFEENIGNDSAKLFIDVILNGHVNQEELELLGAPFNMKEIPNPSVENSLLWQILTGQDDPKISHESYFRRNTIEILMRKIEPEQRTITVLDFVFEAYHDQGRISGVIDETYSLWYYFQLEQFWHIVSSGSLQAFLKYLNQETGGSWISETEFIHKLSKEVHTELIKSNTKNNVANFDQIEVSEQPEEHLAEKVHDSNPIVQLASALILLRKLMDRNKNTISELSILSKKHGLSSPSSFNKSFPEFEKRKNEDLIYFIQHFIHKYLVQRHQWVAIRKMNDTQSTEKFVREDGLIRFLSPIDFAYSSPRLDTLMDFLTDMGLLEKDRSKLTEKGFQLLKEIA